MARSSCSQDRRRGRGTASGFGGGMSLPLHPPHPCLYRLLNFRPFLTSIHTSSCPSRPLHTPVRRAYTPLYPCKSLVLSRSVYPCMGEFLLLAASARARVQQRRGQRGGLLRRSGLLPHFIPGMPHSQTIYFTHQSTIKQELPILLISPRQPTFLTDTTRSA